MKECAFAPARERPGVIRNSLDQQKVVGPSAARPFSYRANVAVVTRDVCTYRRTDRSLGAVAGRLAACIGAQHVTRDAILLIPGEGRMLMENGKPPEHCCAAEPCQTTLTPEAGVTRRERERERERD